jgi:hypothetical protein
MRRGVWVCSLLGAVFWAPGASAADVSASGSAAEEARAFLEAPQLGTQRGARVQPTFLAEGKLTLDNLRQGLDCEFNGIARYDSVDSKRSLLGARTAKCKVRGNRWTVSFGYDVESWGVLEFVSPADILNQRDLNDDILTRQKLGQPLTSLTTTTKLGTFALYGLAWFIPQSYPGANGRLRPQLVVRADRASYDSSLKRANPEAAFRYSNTFQELQVNASYYYGYRKDPDFRVLVDASGEPFLAPSYALLHQGSLELQATLGALLLKSEGALRLGHRGGYGSAAVGLGVEYDLGALLDDGRTISLLGEYDYDSRPQSVVVPFTNDLLAGLRIALNNVDDSQIMVFSSLAFPQARVDVVAIDASSRLLDGLRVALSFRGMPARSGPFADLHKDEYLSLRLTASF